MFSGCSFVNGQYDAEKAFPYHRTITDRKGPKTNRTGMRSEPGEKDILCQESCFCP
jgi:hypothetical protein